MMSNEASSTSEMASSSTPTLSGKHHTPFCRSNCDLVHHDLITALLVDGRYAISRIHFSGDLPTALKQAINAAKSSGWDKNCFVPDPLEQLRCPLLFLACAFGKCAIVEGLLQNNFNPRVLNQNGETALHFAAKHFHLNKMQTAQFGRKGREKTFEKVVQVLTKHDPKILAIKDENGFTALHMAASNILQPYCKRQHKKTEFYQFRLKCLMKRLVELEEASIFTRAEVMDIIKAPENQNGDSVLHILAQRSSYFEVLKFAQDLLFRGKLPEDKNREGKTILSVAWKTDPRGAVRMFSLTPANIDVQLEQGEEMNMTNNQENSVDSTHCEDETLQSSFNVETPDVHIDVTSDHSSDPGEDVDVAAEEQHHHVESVDEQTLYVLTNEDENFQIGKVFSLYCEQCGVSAEKCGCGKNPEGAFLSLENQILATEEFLVDSPPNKSKVFLENTNECEVSGKKVDSKEPYMEGDPNSDADSFFMEFVVTEGQGLDIQAKKNIVDVVMSQYSEKLSQVEGRLPKLVQLMKEEESSLSQKKKRMSALEEELALLKKDMLAKEKCLEELRQQSELLCEKKKTLKRKVSHCQEVQEQLQRNDSKKVRSG